MKITLNNATAHIRRVRVKVKLGPLSLVHMHSVTLTVIHWERPGIYEYTTNLLVEKCHLKFNIKLMKHFSKKSG